MKTVETNLNFSLTFCEIKVLLTGRNPFTNRDFCCLPGNKNKFLFDIWPRVNENSIFSQGVAGGVGSGYRLEDCKKNKTQQIQQIIVVVVLSPTITRTHTHTQTYTKYSNTHTHTHILFLRIYLGKRNPPIFFVAITKKFLRGKHSSASWHWGRFLYFISKQRNISQIYIFKLIHLFYLRILFICFFLVSSFSLRQPNKNNNKRTQSWEENFAAQYTHTYTHAKFWRFFSRCCVCFNFLF